MRAINIEWDVDYEEQLENLPKEDIFKSMKLGWPIIILGTFFLGLNVITVGQSLVKKLQIILDFQKVQQSGHLVLRFSF